MKLDRQWYENTGTRTSLPNRLIRNTWHQYRNQYAWLTGHPYFSHLLFANTLFMNCPQKNRRKKKIIFIFEKKKKESTQKMKRSFELCVDPTYNSKKKKKKIYFIYIASACRRPFLLYKQVRMSKKIPLIKVTGNPADGIRIKTIEKTSLDQTTQ